MTCRPAGPLTLLCSPSASVHPWWWLTLSQFTECRIPPAHVPQYAMYGPRLPECCSHRITVYELPNLHKIQYDVQNSLKTAAPYAPDTAANCLSPLMLHLLHNTSDMYLVTCTDPDLRWTVILPNASPARRSIEHSRQPRNECLKRRTSMA